MPKTHQAMVSTARLKDTEWARATIGDICQVQTTRANPQDLPADTPYLSLAHIESGTFRILAFGKAKGVSSSVTPFEAGDVLFGKLRPYLRKIALAPSVGICTPEILVLKPDSSKVLPIVLHGLVSSPSVIERCVAVSAGTRMPRTKAKDLQAIPVHIPPLVLQRRTGDLIKSVDAYADALRACADAARTASSVLFQDLIRPDGVVGGWRETTLGEVTRFAGGYAFPRAYQGVQNCDIPFVKVSDMNSPGNEVVITSASNTVDRSTLRVLKAKAWPVGTVVFPKVGAALLTEKRRILGVDCAFDNNCMGLIPGKKIDPMFLLLLMRSISLGSLAQHGAVPSVNQGHVATINISLPPMAEQRRIVDIIDSVDGMALAADTARMRLSDLRSGLLSDLISGRHGIPNSYDRFLSGV